MYFDQLESFEESYDPYDDGEKVGTFRSGELYQRHKGLVLKLLYRTKLLMMQFSMWTLLNSHRVMQSNFIKSCGMWRAIVDMGIKYLERKILGNGHLNHTYFPRCG